MRLRALVVAAAVASAGLGVPALTATPAAARPTVTPLCVWTNEFDKDPRWGDHLGNVTAGPFLPGVAIGDAVDIDPSVTSVDVTCEFRSDSATGPVWFSDTQTTPGPAGVYANSWSLGVAAGESIYLCTYTRANPSGSRHFQGCLYAFTG